MCENVWAAFTGASVKILCDHIKYGLGDFIRGTIPNILYKILQWERELDCLYASIGARLIHKLESYYVSSAEGSFITA